MVELGWQHAQLSMLLHSLALKREPSRALAKPSGSGSNPASVVACSTKLSTILASSVQRLVTSQRMRPTLF